MHQVGNRKSGKCPQRIPEQVPLRYFSKIQQERHDPKSHRHNAGQGADYMALTAPAATGRASRLKTKCTLPDGTLHTSHQRQTQPMRIIEQRIVFL